jgi:phosphatidate cytidylyltransferase
MIIALLVLIWITDTFAYFIGMTLGKHRNIFIVSPNKSLEGFIAGIAFAFGFAFLFYKMGFLALKPALFAAFSAGIIGQFGDLFESLLKRDFGVKDSSSLLPGHGGLLDRFDSLMFAAPMFYFLLSFLGNVK